MPLYVCSQGCMQGLVTPWAESISSARLTARNMTSVKDVDAFLYEFKRQMDTHGLVVLEREKNFQALLRLEITVKQRRAVIRSLRPKHYCRGPRPDVVLPGFEFWEFGKQVKQHTLYIKLALRGNEAPAICLSFHPAERPLSFPFIDEV